MPEITDIIHRITYQIEDQELIAATNEVQKTIGKINSLTQLLSSYESKLKQTSRLEIAERKNINTLIERTKTAITQQTAALENQIISNKKLQTEISKEIGLIGRLGNQLDTLKQKRDISNDTAKIKQYNREIAATQSQLNILTGSGGKGSGIGSSILQGLGIGTGIGLLTQGIGVIQNFISESGRLAAETEGVKVAFDRLNDPNLLTQLREATRGTVSDLELMKSAVQFNNFGLPVQKLATALEFARIRAKETGQSVDFLVQSITTGIGRQSPLILDNLGINARRVREEFQKTGDFAEAAFNIISEESKKAGKDLVTFAEQQAKLNAQIENYQAGIGKLFNEIKGGIFAFGKGFFSLDFTTGGFDELEKYLKLLKGVNAELEKPTGLGASLSKTAPRRKITAQNATLNDIGSLTKEELDELKNSIEQARGVLTSANTDQINRLNKLDEAVKKQIETISGSKYQKAQDDKKKKEEEEIERLKKILELSRELNRAITNGGSPTPNRNALGFREEPKGTSPTFRSTPEERAAFNQAEIEIESQKRVDAVEKELFQKDIERGQDRLSRKQKQTQIEKEEQEKIIGYYTDAANSIIGTFQLITDAKVQALDFELEVTQSRIIAATELAKRGNASVLEDELNNLNKLSEEREKLANRQLAINSLLQASGAALAAVQAIQTVTNAGTTGDPYTIPIRIAAAVAALASGIGLVTGIVTAARGFKDGVIDLDGPGTSKSDSIAARLSKGESVITAEKTQRYRPVLEAIHAGTFERSFPVYNTNNSIEIKSVVKELKQVKEAISNIEFSAQNRLDANGLTQSITTTLTRNQNRWKRG